MLHPLFTSIFIVTVRAHNTPRDRVYKRLRYLPLSVGAGRTTEARLIKLLGEFVKQIEPASVIQDAVHEALLAPRPELEGHLLDLESLSRLDLQTRVRRRSAINWKIESAGDQIGLFFHGKRLAMPVSRERELKFMFEVDEFSAAELPGELDDEGKLSLVQSLMREGFLSITDSSRYATAHR